MLGRLGAHAGYEVREVRIDASVSAPGAATRSNRDRITSSGWTRRTHASLCNTSRWASAAIAIAFTSSGSTKLRPSSAAHARDNISFSIGIQSPGVYYTQTAPVYYSPQPVYVQPQPVYVQPQPVYVQPAPVYVQPAPVYVQPASYGYYYDNGRDWRRAEWERRHWRKRHGRDWDRDGDGRRD